VGCSSSFLELVRIAKVKYANYQYFAYSDQDDFWLPNKLIVAVKSLDQIVNQNKLYYSSYLKASKDLQKIEKITLHRKNTLIESFVSLNTLGCSMVFSQNVLFSVSRVNFELVNSPLNHDGITYFCALLTQAHLINDPNGYILYRQHDGNVVGLGADSFFSRVKRLFKYPSHKVLMAVQIYSDLELSNHYSKILNLSCKYKNSIKNKYHLVIEVLVSNMSIRRKIMAIVLIIFNLF